MFGLGSQEIIIILLIAVVLFGAKKAATDRRRHGESYKELQKKPPQKLSRPLISHLKKTKKRRYQRVTTKRRKPYDRWT